MSSAMSVLGTGLANENHLEHATSVKEAELSILRRLGAQEEVILNVQGNLAITYEALGRLDEAILIKRDVYSKRLKLNGEEHEKTLIAANNYASSLSSPGRFEEAKTLLRKTIPIARRVLGENHEVTLRIRWIYAEALYRDNGATFDDLRAAVTSLEDMAQTARRVFGGAHPITKGIENDLQNARVALGTSEMREAMEVAMAAMTAGDA